MQKKLFKNTAGLLAAACTLAIGVAETASAQSIRIPMYVKNAKDAQDTLVYGVEPGATLGIDPALGEEEYPPFPPSQVFHSRFVTPAGHPTDPPGGLGEGTKLDIRGWSSATQIDTFRIRFQPGENGTPVTFSWPSGLSAYATQMTLKVGGDLIDMFASQSFTVTDPDLSTATIYKVGSPASSVREIEGMATYGFWLKQNEPNPVRGDGGTVIQYRITRPASVSLRLYDALGRKIQTVVEENQPADLYTVQLNTADLVPGVYYYTLIAGQFQSTKALVVLE
jgi:hypothetical protein